MPLFIHGTDMDYEFPTSQGTVGAIAEVAISGSTLELRDVAVYAGDGERLDVGVRQLLEVARMIEQLAALDGFKRVLITGVRRSGITPGRPVLLDRRIR